MPVDPKVFAQIRDNFLQVRPRVIELKFVIGAAVARVASGGDVREVCEQLRRERPHYFHREEK